MKKFVISILFVLFSFSLFAEPPLPTITFFEFEVDGDSDNSQLKDFAKILNSDLTNRILNTKRFTGIEKAQLNNVLSVLKFQQFSGFTQEQAQKIGNMTNANYLLLGDLHYYGGLYQLNARIVHTETFNIYTTATAQSTSKEELLNIKLPKMVETLVPGYINYSTTATATNDSNTSGSKFIINTDNIPLDFIIIDSNGVKVAEGKTPFTRTHFPIGIYQIELSHHKSFYKKDTQTFEVLPDRVNTFNFEPIPNYFTVNVDSDIDGDAFVDGEFIGAIPNSFRILLDANIIQIKPRNENYELFEYSISDFNASAADKVYLPVEFKIKNKLIKIQTRPKVTCSVRIDNEIKGTTPDFFPFNYGEHKIDVEGFDEEENNYKGGITLFINDQTESLLTINLDKIKAPEKPKFKIIDFVPNSKLTYCKLYIDDQYINELPCSSEIQHGTHKALFVATAEDGTDFKKEMLLKVNDTSSSKIRINIPEFVNYESYYEKKTELPSKEITLYFSENDADMIVNHGCYTADVYDNGYFIGTLNKPISLYFGAHKITIDNSQCRGELNLVVGPTTPQRVKMNLEWEKDFLFTWDFGLNTNFYLESMTYPKDYELGFYMAPTLEFGNFGHWVHVGVSGSGNKFLGSEISDDVYFQVFGKLGYTYDIAHSGFRIGAFVEPGVDLYTPKGTFGVESAFTPSYPTDLYFFAINFLGTMRYYPDDAGTILFADGGVCLNQRYDFVKPIPVLRVGLSFSASL